MDFAMGQAQEKQTARKEQMEEVREVHDLSIENGGFMGRFMRNIMGNITNYNHLYPIWVGLKIRYSGIAATWSFS